MWDHQVLLVGSDIGGFAGTPLLNYLPVGCRWGCSHPLMRGHQLHLQHVMNLVFGYDRVERICREYINLRLLSAITLYLHLFWEVATTGAPILRPLFIPFSKWFKKTYTISDQVLLGPSLMAASIYDPALSIVPYSRVLLVRIGEGIRPTHIPGTRTSRTDAALCPRRGNHSHDTSNPIYKMNAQLNN